MNSKLYSVDTRDIAKGITLAVITAVLTWILQAIDAPGFSVYQIEWAEIGRIALAAGISYVIKNFLSDDRGRVLGKI